MKRFVNSYNMARAAAVLEDHLVQRDPLALWTILRVRWPDLADHLRSHPNDIDALVAGKKPSNTASEQISPLFDLSEVRRVVLKAGC